MKIEDIPTADYLRSAVSYRDSVLHLAGRLVEMATAEACGPDRPEMFRFAMLGEKVCFQDDVCSALRARGFQVEAGQAIDTYVLTWKKQGEEG